MNMRYDAVQQDFLLPLFLWEGSTTLGLGLELPGLPSVEHVKQPQAFSVLEMFDD